MAATKNWIPAILFALFFQLGCQKAPDKSVNQQTAGAPAESSQQFVEPSQPEEAQSAAEPPPPPAGAEAAPPAAQYAEAVEPRSCFEDPNPPCEMTVWFGTNRNRQESDFGTQLNDKMTFGVAAVQIPEYHDAGSLGSPWYVNVFRRLTFQHPDQYLSLFGTVQVWDEDQFWREMSSVLAFRTDPKEKTILLFIHGFNVSFQDSILRAGQLGYDLDNKGVTAVFSWPTEESSSPVAFAKDNGSIDSSEDKLNSFIFDLTEKTGAHKLNIIAHSLGNKGLLRVVQRIVDKNEVGRVGIGQIILAAPAVEREVFQQIAVNYPKLSDRTTLYVSERDMVDKAGNTLAKTSMAGFGKPLTIVDGINTINVTTLNFDILDWGHNYYAESKPVLNDMSLLLLGNYDPAKRKLILAKDGKSWEFRQQ